MVADSARNVFRSMFLGLIRVHLLSTYMGEGRDAGRECVHIRVGVGFFDKLAELGVDIIFIVS